MIPFVRAVDIATATLSNEQSVFKCRRTGGGKADMKLEDKHCKELSKGTPSLGEAEIALMLPDVPGWSVARAPDGTGQLRREFKFKDFLGAIGFVSRLALIAEREQHHPDFAVHYNRVDVTSWTHTVQGISENDFILAAKINTLDV